MAHCRISRSSRQFAWGMLMACLAAAQVSAQPTNKERGGSLNEAPEIDLYSDYAKKSTIDLVVATCDVLSQNADTHDAFVSKLAKERLDLTGLPFIMGEDCKLSAGKSHALAEASLAARSAAALAPAIRRTARQSVEAQLGGMDPIVYGHYRELGRLHSSNVAGAYQVASGEAADMRLALAKRLQQTAQPYATPLLVKLALYDVDADVRDAALQALADRPSAEYRADVLKGFRYPWPTAAENAAKAVIALNMNDAVPHLESLLREPAPTAPFTVKADGKEKTMVRELVRVNHHRNCMLCHPPVQQKLITRRFVESVPVGQVLSMQEEFPRASSGGYGSSQSLPSGILVRADITYLRQDFSLLQKVENPGKWPEMQRYDFFVRVREATEKEKRASSPEAAAPYRQAVQRALDGLKGQASVAP